MQIKNLITETKLVNWQELKDLQPIDLKNHYHGEKVKQSIIKNGFASAIYVWQEPKTNDIYITDGHCRSQILHELYNDGYQLPEQLPCTFLDNKIIKTKKQAIKILLEVFNIKTNPINKDNLIEWLKVEEVAIEEVKIEELHIEELGTDWGVKNDNKNETDNIQTIQGIFDKHLQETQGFHKLTLLFNAEQYEIITNLIKIHKVNNITNFIFDAIYAYNPNQKN